MTVRIPITLDRNENRYGPAPACGDLLRGIEPDLLHDYPRDFQSGHYSRLSQRLAVMHGVEERRIILGYGCEDILKEAVHHYVGPGDAILVPSASWWYYRAVADEVEGLTVEYPLVETPTGYRYDLDALLALRERGPVKLLLIATPNNPTGNALDRASLRTVLERYRGVPVLLDQAYFGFNEGERDDFGSLTHEYPDLLVLRSFSKLYALAGARIGYALAGTGHERLVKFCSRNLGYNRISEALALAALDSHDYYGRIRALMAADRELFYARLRALAGVRVYASEANFVLARFPEAVVPRLDEELRRRGFIVKFFKEDGFLDCARITLGTREENAALLDALHGILPALLVRAA
ncbi:MAG: pyridoxal phosphate-dependent aminotransferase [Candidatus Krumholzibacteriia bacterium]